MNQVIQDYIYPFIIDILKGEKCDDWQSVIQVIGHNILGNTDTAQVIAEIEEFREESVTEMENRALRIQNENL